MTRLQLAKRYRTTERPRNLTVVGAVAGGGGGELPGTLEEWAQEGLVRQFITPHYFLFPTFVACARPPARPPACSLIGPVRLHDADLA
eukprot:SAG11_NODE_14458_length_611_cov_1.068359_2_plen_88_part_00